MSSPEERIRELARKSAIDPADAARLLQAVQPPALRRDDAWWNPFERWSAGRATVIGAGAALVAAALAPFGVRTNGALDIQRTLPTTFVVGLLDQLLAFPFTAVLLWGAARLAAARARLVDVLAAVGLARLPAVIALPALALLAPLAPPEATLAAPATLVSVVLALAAFGAHVFLLVVGFRTASGLSGPRLVVGFVAALGVAEIASKLVLTFVH